MSVWTLVNKGKDKVSIRKGSSISAEGYFSEQGFYTLNISTPEDRKGPVAVRSVQVKFSLVYNGDVDDPIVVKKIVHCKKQKDIYQFSVLQGQSVTFEFEASTQAILKPMVLLSNITYSKEEIKIKESEAEEEINLTEQKIEEIISSLKPEEKAKLIKVKQLWPKKEDYNEITYPQHKAIEEMSRNSVFKQRAFELGLIRPFLLFVSMDPQTRLYWSFVLKIDLISKDYYGDSHRESFKLLTRKQKGLQPRASHAFTESARPLKPNPTWYQIIHRVCRKAKSKKVENGEQLKQARKTHKEALECCLQQNNNELLQMEEIFSKLVKDILLSKLEDDNKQYCTILRERMNSSDIDPLINNLKIVGYKDEELMKFIAASSSIQEEIASDGGISKWAESKAEGTAKKKAMIVAPIVMISAQLALGVTSPLTVIPAILLVRNTAAYVFRETPGRLLSPLISLMKQKDILAYHSIKIDDYYPSEE